MTAAPDASNLPAPPIFPPRRAIAPPGTTGNLIDLYLCSLADCLAGQIDSALEADGIITPLGSVARAALVEAIGADLEAAVRDLMLSGLPRSEAEARAISELGSAPRLGRDLLIARRRRAVEAWQHSRESVWWWIEPLIPVALVACAVFVAALGPTLGIIAGMAAEPHLGTLAVALVPLIAGLLAWAAGALAPDIGDKPSGR